MFLKYDIKVRIGQKEASFGKGVIELMEGVERTGSLSAAYKAMNMSSSKAWKIIQRAQQDLGIVLFESKSGDRALRRRMLYPTELRGQQKYYNRKYF